MKAAQFTINQLLDLDLNSQQPQREREGKNKKRRKWRKTGKKRDKKGKETY
jgi:hypothetical protein